MGIRKEVISPSDITVQFFIQDNQGSVMAVLNEDGTISQKLSYDAWGMRRYADGSEDVSNSINAAVSRDYTDHEHLPGSRIINMNGRMYDPELGRHLSADPYTPEPFSLQGYNRYAYVLNNPLRYIDPSGYDQCEPSDGCHNGITEIIVTAPRSGGGSGGFGIIEVGEAPGEEMEAPLAAEMITTIRLLLRTTTTQLRPL